MLGQLGICFHGLTRFAVCEVVGAAGAVFFAFAHAIDVLESFLVVILRVFSVAQVSVCGSESRVRAAEVRVERYRLLVEWYGLFKFACPLQILSEAIGMSGFKRACGKCSRGT